MLAGFTHRPGNHCGSTALHNLFAFHGVECSEALLFGLGAGAGFYFIPAEEMSPSRFTNGRCGRLEEQFVELVGCGLRLQTDPDPNGAWDMARAAIDGGRPAILLTDLFYLDHYGSSAHFPGHAVTLAGYDETHAFVSDTAFEDLQRTSLDGLREARSAKLVWYPLDGHMFHAPEGLQTPDVAELAPISIARGVKEMLDPSIPGGYQGLPALDRMVNEIEGWPEILEDWSWCARFLYQVIERRGTGGGNFRLMYGDFLEEVGREADAERARDAAARWSELAALAYEASEQEAAERALWARIGGHAAEVRDAERRLWESLD